MHDRGGGVYPCMIEVEVCIHAWRCVSMHDRGGCVSMHDRGGGVYPCMMEVEICIHA